MKNPLDTPTRSWLDTDMNNTHTFTSKKSSELAVGDVVRTYGMRCQIDQIDVCDVGPFPTVYSCTSTVLNRDEVVASGQIPAGYLNFQGRNDSWTIQGNDLRIWTVEA